MAPTELIIGSVPEFMFIKEEFKGHLSSFKIVILRKCKLFYTANDH